MSNKVPQIRFNGYSDAWEERKLSDLTESHNSGVYIPKDQYGEGTNIIGVGDIYDSDVVDGKRYRLAPVKDKRFILHTNDLLYGESSLVPEGIARVVSVSEAGAGTAFAWHTRRFKVNQVTLNSRFLGLELDYWLPARSHLMRSSTKTALTGITTQDFFNTQIVFPSKPEQEKIATLINSLDTAIALRQRKLELLKEQKKGYLQKMFPKHGAKVPELRFAGFADDWEERKFFESIASTIDFRGRTPKKLGMDWSESGYLALSALNVKNGYIDPLADAHYGDENLYKKWMSGKELKKGQVLFTTEAPMGNVAQVPDNNGYILSQRTVAFETKEDMMTNDFLAVLLKSPLVSNNLSALSSGGTAKGVSQKSLKGLSITVPFDIDEQQKIGSFFKQLDDTIALHQRKLDLLKEQKKGFLQKMFV